MTNREYLRQNVLLLSLTAMYKAETENSCKKFFYRMWRLTISVNFFYFPLSAFMYIRSIESGDFQQLLLQYFYLADGIFFWVRVTYFYLFDEKCDGLIKEMRALFRYETRTGIVEKNLAWCSKFADDMTRTWVVSCALAVLSVAIGPMIFDRNQKVLPLMIWFPFDWTVSPYYEMVVAYQIILMQIMSLTVTGLDTFFFSCVLLTTEQFKFLGWELKHLLHTILLKYNREYFDFDNSSTREFILESEELQSDLMEKLSEYVKFHQSLLSFCARIDDFFSPIFLIWVIFGAAVVIFGAASFTLASANILIFITSGMSLVFMSISMFFPCCFGQLLQSQCEEVLEDLYDFPWYLSPEKFKVSFKILMIGVQRPVRLSLGKFGYLTLNMYLRIVNTAASYILVLNRLGRN